MENKSIQEKVSVIVPVYNVEKYIRHCAESLLRQDYSNIEIILVDDGSPDGSGKIIDEIASNDQRVRVIHKTNGGVSSARNAGIEAASGEWILFVDGDDWVEPDYVSYFVDLVQSTNCQIGMNTRNYYIDSVGTNSDEKQVVSAEKVIEWIYSGTVFMAVWNKIYNANVLKKGSISFSKEIWFGEGMLFNIDCLQYVDDVAIGNKMVYHQTFNPGSAMRSFNLASNYCGIASLWLQRSHWKKSNPQIEMEWR